MYVCLVIKYVFYFAAAHCVVLDEGDIALLKTYGAGQYSKSIKQAEDDIQVSAIMSCSSAMEKKKYLLHSEV